MFSVSIVIFLFLLLFFLVIGSGGELLQEPGESNAELLISLI